jgi:hypothetical protein
MSLLDAQFQRLHNRKAEADCASLTSVELVPGSPRLNDLFSCTELPLHRHEGAPKILLSIPAIPSVAIPVIPSVVTRPSDVVPIPSTTTISPTARPVPDRILSCATISTPVLSTVVGGVRDRLGCAMPRKDRLDFAG